MEGTSLTHGSTRPRLVRSARPFSSKPLLHDDEVGIIDRTRHDSRYVAEAHSLRLPVVLASLAVFTLLWTVYFTVTEAPVAIKHDMAEAYTWGIEWQLGYNQHPPFWAWICGLWFSVFPRTGWAFALLSSLNAATGLLGAWMAIGNFAEGAKRRAAWVLLLLTPLYTFYAYKYNANTIFFRSGRGQSMSS